MKKFFTFLLLAATWYSVGAQRTIKDANVEKRTVGSFHGIEVSTGINLILTEGSEEEVAVSASKDEYRDKIVTEVRNGILRIHYETKLGAINRKEKDKHLRAYVSYKNLDKLNVNTGAEVELNGVLKTPSLDLEANTGGIVSGEIDIMTFKVSQNTGSKITITGSAGSLEVEGDTGSKFLGEGLKTASCTAAASTGAGIYITVQKALNANANTGGNIRYRGDGVIQSIKTSTGGSVSRI